MFAISRLWANSFLRHSNHKELLKHVCQKECRSEENYTYTSEIFCLSCVFSKSELTEEESADLRYIFIFFGPACKAITCSDSRLSRYCKRII